MAAATLSVAAAAAAAVDAAIAGEAEKNWLLVNFAQLEFND